MLGERGDTPLSPGYEGRAAIAAVILTAAVNLYQLALPPLSRYACHSILAEACKTAVTPPAKDSIFRYKKHIEVF